MILETNILIEEQGPGGIAVVMDGMQILRKVEDGKKFHKVTQGKGRGNVKSSKVKVSRNRRDQNVSSEDDDTDDFEDFPPATAKRTRPRSVVASRPVAPLPSRAQSSTANPRPTKRKRQQSSDHEDENLDGVEAASMSHIPGQQDRTARSQSRTQAVVRDHHITPHVPSIASAVPPLHQHSRKHSNPPLRPRSSSLYPAQSSNPPSHLHNGQQTHRTEPPDLPGSHYPRRPSAAPSHRVSQVTHRAAHAIIPPHHVSRHETSTSRASHHRQLTPVFEDHEVYPRVSSHRHPPPQTYAAPQYYSSTNQGQRLRQSHYEDIPPVRYPLRYDPGGGGDDADYHQYHNREQVYDSQGADYDDDDLYTL